MLDDPTNIDKHYLFRIYCSIVLVETFPVCRVAGLIEIITNSAQLGLELGLSLAKCPFPLFIAMLSLSCAGIKSGHLIKYEAGTFEPGLPKIARRTRRG